MSTSLTLPPIRSTPPPSLERPQGRDVFWPADSTPRELADLMVGLACIPNGCRVLEPSAGAGALVWSIREMTLGVKCTAVDPNPEYRNRLRVCASSVIDSDFLTVDFKGRCWPRIVAAPPRENQADRTHLMRLWDLLAPDGIAVVLMGHIELLAPHPADPIVSWLKGKLIAHETRLMTADPSSELTTILVLSKHADPTTLP